MSLSLYYEQICKAPILTKEEEADLFLELNDDGVSATRKQKIRDILINSNLRFVFKQAKKHSKNDPDLFEELIAAGNEGLIVGLDKFDPKSGVRLLTYAGFWVLQRILKQMSSLRIVSLPIQKQQLAAKIQKICETNESITLADLKVLLPDVPEKDLNELFQTRYLTYYIEDMTEEEPGFEVNPIEAEVERNIDEERMQAMINELPPECRDVIIESFGFRDGEEKKITEVAKLLGMTKKHARDLKKQGLDFLKLRMGPESPF